MYYTRHVQGGKSGCREVSKRGGEAGDEVTGAMGKV